MTHPWPDLKWWNSGERQAAEEKIDDLVSKGIPCFPETKSLYRALRATPEKSVRVCIVAQDPYPTEGMATGVAFSIPKDVERGKFPQTLRIILGELQSDLGYPVPSHGDLNSWTSQGVLLWNAIPSVQRNRPLSNDWEEWHYLTREIIQRLSEKGIVFAFLGNAARSYADEVDLERNRVICTSHPSPRGVRSSKTPFTGSRLFSTINARLVELSLAPIDWNLNEEFNHGNVGQGYIPPPELDRGRVLPNITGANLGGLKRQGTSPNIYTSLVF